MLTSKWHTLNANCQKFNAAYKRAKRLGKSGENDVDYLKRAQSIYRDEHKGVAFSQEDAWAEDLFGHDARPRPAGKPRPAKETKSDATASTDGSSASTQFGELMEHELRQKREAAERAFEAQAEKDRTLMRLKELSFANAPEYARMDWSSFTKGYEPRCTFYNPKEDAVIQIQMCSSDSDSDPLNKQTAPNEAEEAFLHDVREDKETVKVGASSYRRKQKCTFIGNGSDEIQYSFRDTKSHRVIRSKDITFVDSIYGARSATDSSSLTEPIQKSQVVLVDIPENLAENDSIVAEHGLSSEITQSPVERADEVYSENGASPGKEDPRTPQYEDPTQRKKTSQRLWMFKVKEEQNGRIRYKARMVVKGFQQKWRVDYNEIFSPVVKITTIKYTKSSIHLVKKLKVCSWAKLVRILISEGSLSLLKILGTKSLAEMFTRIPCIESLIALRLVGAACSICSTVQKIRVVALLKGRVRSLQILLETGEQLEVYCLIGMSLLSCED
ncbi:glutathione S-transferase T3-like protein [Tanacetum coccineum]